ncbi:hypothetical protein JMUB6875_23830 [Nocardia sp. JMUB6875]|uniref:hypothetical protein n=1 Tax=Nocardia sp. JMUB6875 TaxID=3158170 RepID=UPI0032E78CBE
MSYPYGPEDQAQPGFGPLEYPPATAYPQQRPFPWQTAAPATGFGQPGYPVAGYPGPYGTYPGPYGAPSMQASGGTAITAGVLGIILGLLSVLGSIGLIALVVAFRDDRDGISGEDSGTAVLVLVIAILAGVMALMWLVGSVLLLMRKTVGRVLVIIASALGAIGGVINVASGSIVSGVGLLLSLAILVLAAVPPTGRWIAAAKQELAPAQPYYPYY